MAFIHGFHLRNLRGDIYGGLTAAVVALPLALAFGVASGVGPIAGLSGPLFGHAAPGGGVMGTFLGLPSIFADIKWDAAIVGLGVLAVV